MASPIPIGHQGNSLHRPLPHSATPASPPNKRDLKSWWKGFKLPYKQHDHPPAETSRAPGIFGIPLRQSIAYANVAISLIDENGESYIYGYVPIVVAKCGVYLKEKATGVEGIFRLSGSEKRIKELKQAFDSPDRYGKGLVWDGYTVHDAANVLRRYLNDLPEPVVPLDLYEKFREPLRGATKQALGDAEGPQLVDNFDELAAIRKYQQLITELPPLNRQLLLYILDLLAVFSAKSDENRMNSQNLAAIFQPGMLSHPHHAMAPEEYRLNQCVLIFLIENQDHFLIGMQGTAADETTMKEVELGTPTTPKPKGVTRTASNASAGANSVRKEGQVRRNRSVSSKHSRHDGSIGSLSPNRLTPTATALGRSNTVPSKKSPALAGGKFRKNDGSGHHQSSTRVQPMTPVRPTMVIPESRTPSPSSASPTQVLLATGTSTASVMGRSQERLLDGTQESPSAPAKERHIPSLFQRSPVEGGEKRQPKKLRKKRIPGIVTISAHSSNASLPHSNGASPAFELTNPMEPIPSRSQQTTSTSAIPKVSPPATGTSNGSPEPPALAVSPLLLAQPQDAHSASNSRPSESISHNLHPDEKKRAVKSPPTSIHSSYNDGSDLDQIVEGMAGSFQSDNPDKEKKKLWRISRTRREENGGSHGPSGGMSSMHIWSNTGAEMSTTTVGSGGSRTRKSATQDGSEYHGPDHSTDVVSSVDGDRDDGKDEPKGPIGWIKSKYREAKENAEHRRTKSPPAGRDMDRQALGAALHSRGKSLELKGEANNDEKKGSKGESGDLAESAVTTALLTEAPSHTIRDTPQKEVNGAEETKPLATEGHQLPTATVPQILTERPSEEVVSADLPTKQATSTLNGQAAVPTERLEQNPVEEKPTEQAIPTEKPSVQAGHMETPAEHTDSMETPTTEEATSTEEAPTGEAVSAEKPTNRVDSTPAPTEQAIPATEPVTSSALPAEQAVSTERPSEHATSGEAQTEQTEQSTDLQQVAGVSSSQPPSDSDAELKDVPALSTHAAKEEVAKVAPTRPEVSPS
ncbi:hypothetical protein E4U57_003440 [Claviceps arundinis]|uniref:Rho-GAP domain-containing protein n=1 Tax=Claviceps arundinis TaxID=1623583 RepID=A0A9P7MNZ7_9HYPO|nr:hypothetical protein E4U57_003440 [Claviceps arundinis]KAG5963835.1 hypothetical protein E4U56_002577 [Claviceps arundinis]